MDCHESFFKGVEKLSIVTLASGGLDSSIMALLIKQEGIKQYPLFLNYGQLSAENEWKSCLSFFKKHELPTPVKINISDYGRKIQTGLTNKNMDVYLDAFFPGRNLLFLLVGCAYAYQENANSVAIGLLNEETHIFPDQTKEFIKKSEEILYLCMGKKTNIIAPLMEFYKADILKLAEKYEISETYSCHSGQEKPCGICISCKEILYAIERRK